jgi:phosphoglycerate kinase
MARIDDFDFKGKRVLVRVDFNVPFNRAYEVTDDTRIRAALPTIEKIISGGGIAILMSHLGRPDGIDDRFSLRHVIPKLTELLGKAVVFSPACVGHVAMKVSGNLKEGQVCLLENLRFHPEEKAGDEFFAGQLAEHADVYINDAFGTAHRAHASTAIIARFFPHDKLFGYVMEREIENIDKVLHHAESPVCAIVGGAKVSSKISILENLLEKADHIIIGGGMAFTFIKAMGGQVGSSLIEDDKLDMALDVLEKAKANNTEIHLPIDSKVADKFENEAESQIMMTDSIQDGWMGLDIGPAAIDQFSSLLEQCLTILWNGPMGVFEMENFSQGTAEIARKLAEVTKENGAFTLIGGGDSVAAINKFNLANEVSYVSTGGGAMLEYLEGKTLPGIAAIKDSESVA